MNELVLRYFGEQRQTGETGGSRIQIVTAYESTWPHNKEAKHITWSSEIWSPAALHSQIREIEGQGLLTNYNWLVSVGQGCVNGMHLMCDVDSALSTYVYKALIGFSHSQSATSLIDKCTAYATFFSYPPIPLNQHSRLPICSCRSLPI